MPTIWPAGLFSLKPGSALNTARNLANSLDGFERHHLLCRAGHRDPTPAPIPVHTRAPREPNQPLRLRLLVERSREPQQPRRPSLPSGCRHSRHQREIRVRNRPNRSTVGELALRPEFSPQARRPPTTRQRHEAGGGATGFDCGARLSLDRGYPPPGWCLPDLVERAGFSPSSPRAVPTEGSEGEHDDSGKRRSGSGRQRHLRAWRRPAAPSRCAWSAAARCHA
jgi:hypothetical protein